MVGSFVNTLLFKSISHLLRDDLLVCLGFLHICHAQFFSDEQTNFNAGEK